MYSHRRRSLQSASTIAWPSLGRAHLDTPTALATKKSASIPMWTAAAMLPLCFRQGNHEERLTGQKFAQSKAAAWLPHSTAQANRALPKVPSGRDSASQSVGMPRCTQLGDFRQKDLDSGAELWAWNLWNRRRLCYDFPHQDRAKTHQDPLRPARPSTAFECIFSGRKASRNAENNVEVPIVLWTPETVFRVRNLAMACVGNAEQPTFSFAG
jgi:hypothetical protein